MLRRGAKNSAWEFAKTYLSPAQRARILRLRIPVKWAGVLARKAFWPMLNPIKRAKYGRRSGLAYNLGCSGSGIPGFVNIDLRFTPEVAFTCDLATKKLPGRDIRLAFSNAFFEHLPRPLRAPHLQRIRETLDRTVGRACYIGIPHFANIARFYLERAPGTAGPVFDLYNVYRYTHGDPDRMPSWYIAQLHKSLFDEEELASLLSGAGFQSFVLFEYAFPGDLNPMAVNLGFYAAASGVSEVNLVEECRQLLTGFSPPLVSLETLRFLGSSAVTSAPAVMPA